MRYKGQGATYYVIDSIQSEENVSSKMSKPQYMNQTLSLNGRKVVSLVAFALFTSFRLPTLSYVVFFFCSSHIIISMLQEGLSSRSCSIDPAYQTSLTYCFFSAIGFTSAIANPCMWGNQSQYDWTSSLFQKNLFFHTWQPTIGFQIWE